MGLLDFFRGNKNKSKNVAKDRLKVVLVHDRSDLSPQFLDMIKSDMIRVVKEYAVIDEKGLVIKQTRMRREEDGAPTSALVANIPIIRVKGE